MRSVFRLALTTILFAAMSLFALAQGNNPPASTKEAGQTSGGGMTGVEQIHPRHAKAGAEAQIHALDEQHRQAALKGDTSFFEKYLAQDYLGVAQDGREITRDEIIQRLKNGTTKYEAIDVRDTKIHMYGNTAVVTHDAFVKGTANGQPRSGESRATFVWVKQGNDWKLASGSIVPVQGAASAATQK